MSTSIASEMKHVRHSKMVGIQFGLMSADMIERGSVVEITKKETFANGRPVPNGLFDTRMGVIDAGAICPTDGHDYIRCPGYPGHIKLAMPVFHMHMILDVIKWLNCVCIRCSVPKFNKKKYSKLLKMMRPGARWDYISSIASSPEISYCSKETDGGCNCLHPKIVLRSTTRMFGIDAIWTDTANHTHTVEITPDMAFTILSRVSDENVDLMGWSPVWARPEWMICYNLLVPPPAVRPSVTYGGSQRSEDDLTHGLVSIVKTNLELAEKLKSNRVHNDQEIVKLHNCLTNFIAALVDNNGTKMMKCTTQRTNRDLKDIKSRINGKNGRVRGNLMSKRVDFSGRSVITADPNLSMEELGIPVCIAIKLTKPTEVNSRNIEFMMKLVRNGPDKYPGARFIDRVHKNEVEHLHHMDLDHVKLHIGDVVHRHLLDGDTVLFNRQPTLHRSGLLGHLARILMHGNTFRLNLAATKGYNADFDGDEMNLHVPQNAAADAEILHLAAIKHHIVNPANNTAIVGIFQDSMLGSYLFTRPDNIFLLSEAMGLLSGFDQANGAKLIADSKYRDDPRGSGPLYGKKRTVTSFDILSQIIPPISFKATKVVDGNVPIAIDNGIFVEGRLTSKTLGDDTVGLIQRIYNAFGVTAAANFVDNLQNLINRYMRMHSFSCGISDLTLSSAVKRGIQRILSNSALDVDFLIRTYQMNMVVNNTELNNRDLMENDINNILSKTVCDSGALCRESMSANNRFLAMANAGSKGSKLQIQSMTVCLGQQKVQGKRIPYGYHQRTLPHFARADDSPEARGFVSSSYIKGLSPTEFFFHAMGGREGLIDTAVKTSETGYIQRRLVKAMEILMVHYDHTVRTNMNNIVQFSYGEDSFDAAKVVKQSVPILSMSMQDIYQHYVLLLDVADTFTVAAKGRHRKQTAALTDKSSYYITWMLSLKSELITNVFQGDITNKAHVYCAVHFEHIIDNVVGQFRLDRGSLTDITMLETYEAIEACHESLRAIRVAPPTLMFSMLFFYYLSPKSLIIDRRFNRDALLHLLNVIATDYQRALVAPGEMVGIIAAQSEGEASTQMTLNTFHLAGISSKDKGVGGVPRLGEILTLTSNMKSPSMTIYPYAQIREPIRGTGDTEDAIKKSFKEATALADAKVKDAATKAMHTIGYTLLKTLIVNNDGDVVFDRKGDLVKNKSLQYERAVEDATLASGRDGSTKLVDRSKWVIRLPVNRKELKRRGLSIADIISAISRSPEMTVNQNNKMFYEYDDDNSCTTPFIYIYLASNLTIVRAANKNINKSVVNATSPIDQTDLTFVFKSIKNRLLNNVVVRGVKGISHAEIREIKHHTHESAGGFETNNIWVIDTVGSNLSSVLAMDHIDSTKTISNNIREVHTVLGIEAARQTIMDEVSDVFASSKYLNSRHYSLLADRMTFSGKLISIIRSGLKKDDTGPIMQASFEETNKVLMNAGKHAEFDTLRGVSATIMGGQEGHFGTGAFKVMLDLKAAQDLNDGLATKKSCDHSVEYTDGTHVCDGRPFDAAFGDASMSRVSSHGRKRYELLPEDPLGAHDSKQQRSNCAQLKIITGLNHIQPQNLGLVEETEQFDF